MIDDLTSAHSSHEDTSPIYDLKGNRIDNQQPSQIFIQAGKKPSPPIINTKASLAPGEALIINTLRHLFRLSGITTDSFVYDSQIVSFHFFRKKTFGHKLLRIIGYCHTPI